MKLVEIGNYIINMELVTAMKAANSKSDSTYIAFQESDNDIHIPIPYNEVISLLKMKGII